MAITIPATGSGTPTPPVATTLKGSDHVQSIRMVPIAGKRTHATEATIAAGGQATLDSDQITSAKTGHLYRVHVSSSVPIKAELRTVSNGVASSNLDVGFGAFGQGVVFVIPGPEFVSVAHDATAGLDAFRVVVTNLDPSEPADAFATFYYEEL